MDQLPLQATTSFCMVMPALLAMFELRDAMEEE